jgi:hypothetical protein
MQTVLPPVATVSQTRTIQKHSPCAAEDQTPALEELRFNGKPWTTAFTTVEERPFQGRVKPCRFDKGFSPGGRTLPQAARKQCVHLPSLKRVLLLQFLNRRPHRGLKPRRLPHQSRRSLGKLAVNPEQPLPSHPRCHFQ